MERFQVFRGPDRVPSWFGDCVVAFGKFDGVHRGHQALVRRMLVEADEVGVRGGVALFARNPLAVLRPQQRRPAELTGLDERLRLLQACGARFVVVLPTEPSILSLTALEFARDVLRMRMRVRRLVVGEGFTFGKGGVEGIPFLRENGQLGIDGVQVPTLAHDGVCISSTLIRRRLLEGDLDAVATMLGRPFAGVGTVRQADPFTVRVPGGRALPAPGRYRARLRHLRSGGSELRGVVDVPGEDRSPAGELSGPAPVHLSWRGPGAARDRSYERVRLTFDERIDDGSEGDSEPSAP